MFLVLAPASAQVAASCRQLSSSTVPIRWPAAASTVSSWRPRSLAGADPAMDSADQMASRTAIRSSAGPRRARRRRGMNALSRCRETSSRVSFRWMATDVTSWLIQLGRSVLGSPDISATHSIRHPSGESGWAPDSSQSESTSYPCIGTPTGDRGPVVAVYMRCRWSLHGILLCQFGELAEEIDELPAPRRRDRLQQPGDLLPPGPGHGLDHAAAGFGQ